MSTHFESFVLFLRTLLRSDNQNKCHKTFSKRKTSEVKRLLFIAQRLSTIPLHGNCTCWQSAIHCKLCRGRLIFSLLTLSLGKRLLTWDTDFFYFLFFLMFYLIGFFKGISLQILFLTLSINTLKRTERRVSTAGGYY